MKKDYIVLNGANATYTNSRLQWNGLIHNYFPNFDQNGHDDIYLSLSSVNFATTTADNDAATYSCNIDTNLKFGNMNATGSGSSLLGIVGCGLKTLDDATTQILSSTNSIMPLKLKLSEKFNMIQLGVSYEGLYLDLDGDKNVFYAILEVEYRKNDTQELKISNA